MRQNIIMIVVLIVLFFFGLIIYDFSDELSKVITAHSWYSATENIQVISFKNNRFSYYDDLTNEAISPYEKCITYRYNRSINVVKLNCKIPNNKLYISSISEDKITITINGQESDFYKSKDIAKIEKVKKNNNLSDEEYQKLLNFDLNLFSMVSIKDIDNFYKAKESSYIAIVNKNNTFENALNILSLSNFSKNNLLSILIFEDLRKEDFEFLNKLNENIPINSEDFNLDIISIYLIGEKKLEWIKDINTKNISELN